jgi:hypothetical protein
MQYLEARHRSALGAATIWMSLSNIGGLRASNRRQDRARDGVTTTSKAAKAKADHIISAGTGDTRPRNLSAMASRALVRTRATASRKDD